MGRQHFVQIFEDQVEGELLLSQGAAELQQIFWKIGKKFIGLFHQSNGVIGDASRGQSGHFYLLDKRGGHLDHVEIRIQISGYALHLGQRPGEIDVGNLLVEKTDQRAQVRLGLRGLVASSGRRGNAPQLCVALLAYQRFERTDVEKTGDSTHAFFDNDGVSPPSPGTAFLNGVIFGGIPGNVRDTFSDDDLTPELIVEWSPSETVNAYAKFAQGFKSGGYNGDFSSDPALAIDFRFRSETVDSFEVGVKSTLLDGAMYFNVAAFRSEYEDLQAAIFDAATTQFLVTNAGEAITQGLEVELNWQATESLRVDASLGFLNAEYDDFPNGPCTAEQLEGLASGCINGERQDLTGQPLNYAPDLSGSLRFSYDRPLGNALRLSSFLDVKYMDEFFTALDNEPNLVPDAHAKLDFGIAIGDQDDTWDIGLLALNLTDEETFRAGGDMPTSNLSYIFLLDKPRTFAIRATYRW